MITKKQIKKFGLVKFERYSLTGDGDEIFTEVTIQALQDGRVEIVTRAHHLNVCERDQEQILEQLEDLGGLGISLLPDEEDAARIA